MPKEKPKPKQLAVVDPSDDNNGKLKLFGGSQNDAFNEIVASQTFQTLSTHSVAKDRQFEATAAAMMGIAPRDELER